MRRSDQLLGVRSDAVLNELELATNRGKPVVAIRLEAVEPTGSAEYYLRRRQWFDAATRFDARVAELPAAVRTALAAPSRSPRVRRAAASVDDETDDGGLLTARDAERRTVAALLERARTGNGGVAAVVAFACLIEL